jgi:allantoinase
MPDFDILLRNARIVFEDRVERADVAIAEGNITTIDPAIGGSANEEIDCSALHVFPGVIDSHVHFNEPGRAEWEGLATGSRAVAAGGGTCFFDMPLNSDPPVLDGATFDAKRQAAEARSIVDFGIWGGLTPLNLHRLEELAGRGVVGFKAFMSNSGIPEFPRADMDTLRKGMEIATKLGVLVAVHAEDEKRIASHPMDREGDGTVHAYFQSRPPSAEFSAIYAAINLAKETGCALHIVHVSTTSGVKLVSYAKENGLDVTCETCPHYLTLDELDVLNLGAVAKCAPPIRDEATRRRMVEEVLESRIDTLGSDHSPAPPSMKEGDDFFAIWGGIAGAQHLFPLMLDLWQREGCADWPLLSRMLSENVARRFHLPPDLGSIRIGGQANLALVDLEGSDVVDVDRLHYRHKMTPYAGRTLRGRVVRTLLRGQTVARDGQAADSAPAGRLVAPQRT